MVPRVRKTKYRRNKMNDFAGPCRARCTENLVWAIFGVVQVVTMTVLYLLWQRTGGSGWPL